MIRQKLFGQFVTNMIANVDIGFKGLKNITSLGWWPN